MYDLPSKVCEFVIGEKLNLPDSVIELLFLLMQREVERNYLALNNRGKVENPEPFLIPYTLALLFVLRELPPIQDKGKGTFNTTIGELVDLSNEEIYALGQLTPSGLREWSKSNLPPEVRRFDGDFVRQYAGSFWRDLLNFQVSFDLPTKIRFEHTHVVGSVGSGKTQLLQHLILNDLKTTASLIVMTPKGSMIPNIENLADIDPKRLILVHPEDCVQHPLALNVFDIGDTKTEGQTNNAVGLINYIFSSILDASTTSKQTALLNYSIRLLLKVPNATLLTLRALMRQDRLPDEYTEYLMHLSTSAQEFFTNQFGNKKIYGETKEQMLWRLDLLLENTIVERIFSQPKTLLNISAEIERGKVILVDTSIKSLGEFGSAFLGRFFIALVTLASQQRDPKNTRPVFFYIDEASSYLDTNIESLLERARESKVGLILAHQQMAQLKKVSLQLEASVLTNTSVKFVGGCSHSDAGALAREMGLEAETLQQQPPLHFYVKAKGFAQSAIPIRIKAGHMENLPKRTEAELHNVIMQNRAKYSAKFTRTSEIVGQKAFVPGSPDDDIESLNKA